MNCQAFMLVGPEGILIVRGKPSRGDVIGRRFVGYYDILYNNNVISLLMMKGRKRKKSVRMWAGYMPK